MSWRKVKLKEVLQQYRFEHLVQNHIDYKQVTISKYDGVTYRGSKLGKDIGRKRQFIINLDEHPNTLMFVRQGVKDGSIGIATEAVNGCIVTENMPMFSVHDIEIEYLELLIKSPYFKDQLAKISTTGSAQKSIHERQILEIEIPYPSKDEQVLFINEITELKSLNTTLANELTYQLNLVKKLRQQLLQEAIQGKLVKKELNNEPASLLLKQLKAEKQRQIQDKILKKENELPKLKADELPFDIPKNWAWCKLGEISYITSGSTPSQDAFVSSGIPYLKMYNLKNQKIDFDFKPQYIKEEVHNGQLKRCRAYPGDILMNIVGPPLGKIAIIPDHLDQCNFNQAAVLIRPMFKEMNVYIFWYLNEMSEINSIDTKGVAGQANISVTQAHNIKIALPPLNEQRQIVEKLEQLLKTSDALEASIKQSQQQNERLLQQVLRQALTKEIKQEEQLIEQANSELKRDAKHKALLLAAEIIWQLNQKQTLGHIKLQKLIYLCNRTQKMNLPVNFLKWAMGPYDPELQKYIDTTLIKNEWFKYDEDSSLKYQPLKRAGGHIGDFDKYFASEKVAINHLIQLFENAKSARIEIVATLFACWDELIAKKQLVNDNSLLAEFYNWSEKKKKHTTEKVIDALRWMETQGIIPN